LCAFGALKVHDFGLAALAAGVIANLAGWGNGLLGPFRPEYIPQRLKPASIARRLWHDSSRALSKIAAEMSFSAAFEYDSCIWRNPWKMCKSPGLKALFLCSVFRGLKPPAPSVLHACCK
jgi:hypothetical protein